VRYAIVAVVALGCRVPDVDLEGKQCPCATGYVCQTSTSTCVRSPDNPDASFDAPDAPIDPASCLPSPFGTLIYETLFDTPDDWPSTGGVWSISDGLMLQNDESVASAFAYHDVGGAPDHRIVSRVQMLAGVAAGTVGLAARVQGNPSAGQYHCNWGPNDGAFSLERTQSDGLNTFELKATTINLAAIPDYVPTQPVAMELQVRGNQLECCLRGLAGASLTAVDNQFAAGHPGARTSRMSGAYDDYRVYRAP
jgi:hypothetical protein